MKAAQTASEVAAAATRHFAGSASGSRHRVWIALLRYPYFKVGNCRAVLRALELYATYAFLDFGDALIAASMEHASSHGVYSYDTDFDRIPSVERIEP